MALVTIDELKVNIKSYTYDNLTEGDDSVAARAIEKARVWASAKLAQIKDSGFDESQDPVDHDIILKRALYELYAYMEMEKAAEDKKDDAFELLKAKYGSRIDATNQNSAKGDPQANRPASGAIIKPPINKDSF